MWSRELVYVFTHQHLLIQKLNVILITILTLSYMYIINVSDIINDSDIINVSDIIVKNSEKRDILSKAAF